MLAYSDFTLSGKVDLRSHIENQSLCDTISPLSNVGFLLTVKLHLRDVTDKVFSIVIITPVNLSAVFKTIT